MIKNNFCKDLLRFQKNTKQFETCIISCIYNKSPNFLPRLLSIAAKAAFFFCVSGVEIF